MKYNYKYRNAEGEAAPYVLNHNGKKIINPTAEMYAEAGYLPYTPQLSEEEIAFQESEAEINRCREMLYKTDFIPLKSYEGYDCDTLYPNWKEKRAAWRARINEMEARISELKEGGEP